MLPPVQFTGEQKLVYIEYQNISPESALNQLDEIYQNEGREKVSIGLPFRRY